MDGLSHPYLSKHPTQSFASSNESGDIVLSANVPKTNKLNKKFLIIGGIVGAVLIFAIFVFTILNYVSNADKKVINLFRNNIPLMQESETFFMEVFQEDLTIEKIFTEQVFETLNANLPRLQTLRKAVMNIKPSRVSSSVSEDYANIRDRVIDFVETYQTTIELYNTLRSAYFSDDTSELTNLVEDNDYNISILVGRFLEYIERKQRLSEDIIKKQCSFTNVTIIGAPTTECEYLVDAYQDNIYSMQQSTLVVYAIFSAYNGNALNPYDEPIYQDMNDVIILLEEKNE